MEMTEQEYLELNEAYCGVCLSCHEVVDSVEPDAHEYQCPNCGAKKVFGLEEALLMGLLTII